MCGHFPAKNLSTREFVNSFPALEHLCPLWVLFWHCIMHIKKVLLQGFKSYKDQTEFEEFHEGVNVIGKRSLYYFTENTQSAEMDQENQTFSLVRAAQHLWTPSHPFRINGNVHQSSVRGQATPASRWVILVTSSEDPQEGLGDTVMSGSVEIIFDNSDGRFPVI